MGAFDPLFRGRRRRIMGRRAPMMRRSPIGAIGMVSMGYALYRFLRTERGRAVRDTVMQQMRDIGERVRMQSRDIGIQSQSRYQGVNQPQF